MPHKGEADPVGVVDEDDESLAEEERQDREVVPEQTARRQPDEQAHDRRTKYDHRDRRLCLPVVAELRRSQDRVEIRAAAEERDVAEVEKTGKPDDDVEAEGQQRVHEREQSVPEQVPFGRDQREDGGRDRKHQHPRRRREAVPLPRQPAAETGVTLALSLDARDPLVDADPRVVRRVRRPGAIGRNAAAAARRHQTFWIAAVPNRPLGRMRITAIRSAKT